MNEAKLAENYLAEARGEMAACLARIKHCLGQLDDDQLWRRPRESMNSVGNLLLHLCGNLKQRFQSDIDGLPDDRDRQREFDERGPIAKAELLLRLEEAVGAAEAVLAGLNAARLLEGRRYQGLRGEIEGTVLAVVLRTLLHLSGHTQEIVYAARLQLGEAYVFRSQPPPPPAAADKIIAADNVVFERGMLPDHAPASEAGPAPSAPEPPADDAPADDAERAPTEPSPLQDHLLELEQEFQDQEEEGKL